MTSDSPQSPEKSLEERLADRVGARPSGQTTALRQIIALRHMLARERQRGVSCVVLTEALAGEGLNLAAGTLRNYMALIGHALADLSADGETAPDDARIHARVNEILKARACAPAARAHPPRAASAPVLPVASRFRPDAPRPLGVSTLRDPNREL